MFVGRIVRTDCIHIHFLDKQCILQADLFIGSTSSVGMETMAVDTFHYHFRPIDINPVFRAELNGAESDSFFVYMYNLLLAVEQFQPERIEIGVFAIPGTDTFPVSRNGLYIPSSQRICLFSDGSAFSYRSQ